MRKLLISLTILLSTTVITSCSKGNAKSKINKENVANATERDNEISKGAPIALFDKENFDFGTVTEGEIVKTTFVVTNKGKSDLVITDAKATCGCTVPVWPKEPISPGATGNIEVSFNTNGKTNKQSKSVTLYTNTEKGTEIVKISGMVTPKQQNNS